MNESQQRQMEDMNRNFRELRDQNDEFERKLNQLTKEVRGYKDEVVSEIARSEQD